MPISASYESYSANARNSSNSKNESATRDVAMNIAWTGLATGVDNLYTTCIRSKMFLADGLHAAVIGATESDISILVRYHVTGRGDGTTVKWDPPAIEGKVLQTSIPEGFTTLKVPRPGMQMALTGNAHGYTTQDIVLTPLPPRFRQVIECSGRHVVRSYNSYLALAEDIPAAVRGDAEQQVNAQANRDFFYASGAGRHWPVKVDSSSWGAPPGSEIVDGSVRIERLSDSLEIPAATAAKASANTIDLFFQSSTGNAGRAGVPFAIRYTIRTTGQCGSAMVQ